jgi:hypothetical protein
LRPLGISNLNFPHEAKDIGMAILAIAILFGLGVGVAFIFHYM